MPNEFILNLMPFMNHLIGSFMYEAEDKTIVKQSVECEEEIKSTQGIVLYQGIQSDNGLERLYDYFIKETSGDPIPFSRGDIAAIALEVLGGSGGIYSWPSAWEYGKKEAPWKAYSFAITNPISNVLFLVKATDDLIDTVRLESRPPEELKDLIEIPSTRSLIVKYTKMGVGSVICVLPFGIAVYLFPIPGCVDTWCSALTVTHSIVANTILHAISWNLILAPEFWYYRIPTIPFEKLYSYFIKKSCTSFLEIELAKLTEEQHKIYAKYKNLLSDSFTSTAYKIVRGYLRKIESSSETLRSIQNEDMSFIKFVELVASERSTSLDVNTQQQAWWRVIFNNTCSMLSYANGFLSQRGMPFVGAGIMMVGCIGWIANPFYVGHEEGLDLPENIVVGALPSYSTAVLCAFYGAAILQQIYNYFTTWDGPRGKFPLEAQLYPKTFALFLLANMYISYFAYASGHQLIATVFADKIWDDIRPALEEISKPTLQILSFLPLVDLFSAVVRKGVAKFGSPENDDTLAARLLLKMTAIVHYLRQMKGEELMESLKQFSPQQLSALGVNIDEFHGDLVNLSEIKGEIDKVMMESQNDVERPAKLSRSSSSRNNRNAFFVSAEATERKYLLGAQGQESTVTNFIN